MRRSSQATRGMVRFGLGLLLIAALTVANVASVAVPAASAESPMGSTRLIIRFERAPAILGGDVDALAAQQAAFADALTDALPNAVVERQYAAVFSGAAVRVFGDATLAAATLATLPEVAEVYAEIAYEPALQASVAAISADALWPTLGGREDAGSGVTIAVLDSGIDATHPALDPTGWSYPTGLPKGDTRFTTAKVTASRLYVRPEDPPIEGEGTPAPGADASYHGTAMAVAAAGNVVTATLWERDVLVSGVAPGAWLSNYRVFYPNADGEELAYSSELLQAIEDAVTDGADVLLLAWSSPHYVHPLRSPVAQALQAAMNAGVVVVAAAGNVGPAGGSATRLPGGIERVLTAGAVSKGERVVRHRLDVTAPTPVPSSLQNQPYEPTLFGGVITDTWPSTRLQHVQDASVGGSPYACSPLPANALEGSVAIAKRGSCYIADKVFYAQQAGAVALILANTDETTPAFACAGTHCGAGDITIPSVTVAKSVGDDLAAWTTLYDTSEVVLDGGGRLKATDPGIIWEASARGPAYGVALKPDLVAPGVDILTAGHLAGGNPWLQATGTSLAAAQTAGAAALLLEAHPTWDHDAVKAAMVGSADPTGLANEDGSTATLLDRGAGHLRVDLAADAPLLADPIALSLPRVQPDAGYTRVLTLTNVTTQNLTITPTVEVTSAVAITLPGAIALAAGASQAVPLSLRIDADGQGDLMGEVIWTASADRGVVRTPLWVYAEPALATAQVLVIDNDFSNFDGHRDYVDAYLGPALSEAGWRYAVWRADERCGSGTMLTTLPALDTLASYPVIIWMTGDNPHPDGYFGVTTPLTAADQQLLAAYLEGGGRLLALGQNLAQASDVNASEDPVYGRSDLYHGYLGARWIQGSLFDDSQPPAEAVTVSGAPATWMGGVAIDLGPVGDGEGNQISIDEVALGGDPSGTDADLVSCIAGVAGGQPEAGGCVGVAKAEEPALDGATPTLAYRAAYLSFGFEGVSDRQGVTSRAELVGLLMDWLTDEVSVDVPDQLGAPWDVTTITCEPTSSAGAAFSGFRWRIGDGEGVIERTTTQPSVAVVLEEEGWYPLAVEACDDLGHCAMGRGTLRIVAGGNSSLTVSHDRAIRGQALEYEIGIENTATATRAVTVTLPLPDHAVYQGHSDGDWDGDALVWAKSLAAGEGARITLTVTVAEGAPPGSPIIATASFAVEGSTYERNAQTLIMSPVYLPCIRRSG